jgi:transposase
MARADHVRAGLTVRCAIYTRKSSDEGLEQEFNSLDAQREACEAYIVSQRHAGWIALADMYDDGGLSGGTMERPALKRLLEDRPGRFKSSLSTRSHGAWIATSSGGRLRLQIHSTWRRPMPLDHHSEEPTAIRTNLGAIFVSLELSRSTWLITSLSPGGGEKMSKHSVSAGDIAALLSRFSELKQKAFARMGQSFPIIVIQEAGLDGFWIHRVLQSEGIESSVVDAASIATSRRRRRAKTDRIDGEALVRALLAYKRGEPRVCAMVRAPTPEDEDRRRLCRERKTLTVERVQHVNRIKGLLFSQGVSGYEPLRRNRRQRLGELKTGDGRPLPPHLKSQIGRELDRLELLLGQIKAVEAERDALLTPATETEGMPAPQAMLIDLRGIGAEFAAVVWSEGLCRSFANRRQVAAYGGLAPTPWQSGSVAREQGVSKAGNPRLRTTMIQLAWLWLRHQPNSALAQWFKERVKRNGGRLRKTTIVALARKLLVALWKYVTAGVVVEGAVMKAVS